MAEINSNKIACENMAWI